jgi:thioredoxin-like negative regulator of GroEL
LPAKWLQRGVHFLDAAVAVADDQDVRHRGEHALDELVRLFERGILFFERDFVLQEVVVDLVHLLDDLDPGLLAARRQAANRQWAQRAGR